MMGICSTRDGLQYASEALCSVVDGLRTRRGCLVLLLLLFCFSFCHCFLLSPRGVSFFFLEAREHATKGRAAAAATRGFPATAVVYLRIKFCGKCFSSGLPGSLARESIGINNIFIPVTCNPCYIVYSSSYRHEMDGSARGIRVARSTPVLLLYANKSCVGRYLRCFVFSGGEWKVCGWSSGVHSTPRHVYTGRSVTRALSDGVKTRNKLFLPLSTRTYLFSLDSDLVNARTTASFTRSIQLLITL